MPYKFTRSRHRTALVAAVTLILQLGSCGGGGGGSSTTVPNTPPVIPPTTTGPAWWGFGRDAQHSAAWISDNGTASPTVGPDGDVYFGVLESNPPSHNFTG